MVNNHKQTPSNTRMIWTLILVFVGSLLLFTLDAHFCDHLEMGKQSWNQIFHDLWLYIILSLIMTGFIFFKDYVQKK